MKIYVEKSLHFLDYFNSLHIRLEYFIDRNLIWHFLTDICRNMLQELLTPHILLIIQKAKRKIIMKETIWWEYSIQWLHCNNVP